MKKLRRDESRTPDVFNSGQLALVGAFQTIQSVSVEQAADSLRALAIAGQLINVPTTPTVS